MKHLYLLFLVCFPVIILSLSGGPQPFAAAAEDEEEVEDDVDVEGETEDTTMSDEGGDDDDGTQTGASPDAVTTILFTKPVAVPGSVELPSGHMVEFLVGFQNKGKQDFIVETLEASFRYPMDFTFYIQNFSTVAYNKVVKPTHEATLAYSFITPESFAGRPFGLNINLQYRDFEGNLFGESVFNETVNVVELEDGLDGETFFLYVFLAALVVLLLVISQQFLVSIGKKRVGKKPVIETGTSNPNNVDYSWLPSQMRSNLNKMEKLSPKSSPRGGKNHVSPKASKHHQSPKQQQSSKQNQNSKQQQSSKQNQNSKQQQSPKQNQNSKQQQSPKQNQNSKQQQSPVQRKAKRSAGRDD